MKTYTYGDFFLEIGQDGVDLFSFILFSESEDCTVLLEMSFIGFYFVFGKQ